MTGKFFLWCFFHECNEWKKFTSQLFTFFREINFTKIFMKMIWRKKFSFYFIYLPLSHWLRPVEITSFRTLFGFNLEEVLEFLSWLLALSSLFFSARSSNSLFFLSLASWILCLASASFLAFNFLIFSANFLSCSSS